MSADEVSLIHDLLLVPNLKACMLRCHEEMAITLRQVYLVSSYTCCRIDKHGRNQ